MIELALAALIALVAGLAIGWLIAGRATTAARAERDGHAEKARGHESEIATLRERAEQLAPFRMMVDGLREERDAYATELAALRAAREQRELAHAEQLKALNDAREALGHQFAEVGGKLLGDAQKAFLERADARFRQSEETAGQGLKALLQPVHERLERYEQTVGKMEADRQSAFGQLTGQIEAMRAGTERVSGEAAKLVNALRNAPKARGRWGEQQLKNVLESCGLTEHTDFQTEVSVGDGEGGRLRPDAIVRIPAGKALVIDAKVSLNAYQDAFNAVDEAERKAGLDAHALSVRNHVAGLASKTYWAQFDDAPEYVVMFIPGEHFLTAALEHDAKLWDFAFERRVLLATPTNLIAIARTVEAVWKQEKLAKEAAEIAKLGKELYARLCVMGGHVAKLGRYLDQATGAYNGFVGSLEANVLTQARRFEALNVETGGKTIESPGAIEQSARPLLKLAEIDSEAGEAQSAPQAPVAQQDRASDS